MNDDERQHADMVKRWTAGRDRALSAAADWTKLGDLLAANAEQVHDMAPALPNTDPADWTDHEYPDSGIERSDIRRRLCRSVRDAYAMAGVYRRAADRLGDALRDGEAVDIGHDGHLF